MIVVIGGEDRPLEIRTDSQYVIDGVERLRAEERPGRAGDNNDLWQLLRERLSERASWDITFVKVKGHAKDSHVRRGLVSLVDKQGNDAADSLAVQGASLHAVPDPICQERMRRRVIARRTQKMMLTVLRKRLDMERVLKLDVCADGLGDQGDDPWEDSVDSSLSHASAAIRSGFG